MVIGGASTMRIYSDGTERSPGASERAFRRDDHFEEKGFDVDHVEAKDIRDTSKKYPAAAAQ